MARLSFAAPVNFTWLGQAFRGVAGTVFQLDDTLKAQFLVEMGERVPGVTWSPDDGDNGSASLVVGAVNSSVRDQALADWLCDGVADEVQIQAAIDSLSGFGGTVTLAPGTYTLSAAIVISANVRIALMGYGARLLLPASAAGIKVSQGVSLARGATVEGLVIDGQNNASTIGVLLEDTNNPRVIRLDIENCATGLLFNSNAASKFVEGAFLEDLLFRGCTTGWASAVVSGTGSFAQTVARGIKITGSTTGLSFPNGSIFQRGHIEATVWVGDGQTAANLDCNLEDLTLDLAVEGAAGSTSSAGIVIGTNALNADQLFLKLLFTGTITTQANFNSKNVQYWSGGSQMVDSAGTHVFGLRRHGDSANRLQWELLTAGPKLSGGSGGGAVDVNLYRSAADVWTSDDSLRPANVKVQVKAGTPVDGDILGGAVDGMVVADTTGNKLWVRVGGVWKGVAVA